MSFIAQKARSRYHFGWILAPIIAYILLMIGEITGLTLLGSLPLLLTGRSFETDQFLLYHTRYHWLDCMY